MSAIRGGVIGGTFPGAPLVLSCRSDQLGWGVTVAYADDQDVFIEKVNPDNASEVLTPRGYAPLRSRTSIINVADADPVRLTLLDCHINDAAFADAALDVLDGEAGDLPAEGALAPDSYEISVGDERADVLARMADAQVDRISEIWAARNPEVPLESPEQLLTLASIVEKETGVPEERGTVASVFVNRLNQGMRLQTDPTVIYGITRGQGTLGRGLRRSELRRETPWNTYVIEGLPPTPIANPGLASLEAAANPPQSPYIFFVADGTGGHAFAETLREHNANVAKWRAIEAERRNQDN